MRTTQQEVREQLSFKQSEVDSLRNAENSSIDENKQARVKAEQERDEARRRLDEVEKERDQSNRERSEAVESEVRSRLQFCVRGANIFQQAAHAKLAELQQSAESDWAGQLASKNDAIASKDHELSEYKASSRTLQDTVTKLRSTFNNAMVEMWEYRPVLGMNDLKGALDLDELVNLGSRGVKMATYEPIGFPFVHDLGVYLEPSTLFQRTMLTRYCWVAYRFAAQGPAPQEMEGQLYMMYETVFRQGAQPQEQLAPFINQALENIMELAWNSKLEGLFAVACSLYTQSIVARHDERAWTMLQKLARAHQRSSLSVLPTTALLRFAAALYRRAEGTVTSALDMNGLETFLGKKTSGMMPQVINDNNRTETIPELALRLFAPGIRDEVHLFALQSVDGSLKAIITHEVDEPTSWEHVNNRWGTGHVVYIVPTTSAAWGSESESPTRETVTNNGSISKC